VIDFGNGERREVEVAHRFFPNGGGWSFYFCPGCGRRARFLRLVDGRPKCCRCCLYRGIKYRSWGSPAEKVEARGANIERLRARLKGKPRKRRAAFELSLKGALAATRRDLIR
jgi:hypothetical protein